MRPCLPFFKHEYFFVPVITTEIPRKGRKEKLRQFKIRSASGKEELALSDPRVPGNDADEIQGISGNRADFVDPNEQVSFATLFMEPRRGVGWFIHKQGGEERRYNRHFRGEPIVSAAPS